MFCKSNVFKVENKAAGKSFLKTYQATRLQNTIAGGFFVNLGKFLEHLLLRPSRLLHIYSKLTFNNKKRIIPFSLWMILYLPMVIRIRVVTRILPDVATTFTVAKPRRGKRAEVFGDTIGMLRWDWETKLSVFCIVTLIVNLKCLKISQIKIEKIP